MLAAASTLATTTAHAQLRPRNSVEGANVQRLVDGVLGVMSYTISPDVTTSSLSLSNAATSNPSLSMTQLGGGFTWSKSTPLYLEGNAAYARYDPVFVASDGDQTRTVPVKWDAVSATGGIGWDFPLSEHWVVRPIFNFTFGTVASDLTIARWWIANKAGNDLDFLDGKRLKAYGLGGSLMLDYEFFSPAYDDDLEIRYTNVELHSYGTDNPAITGQARSETASVWARRRIPIRYWTVWSRPVRYVLEGAYTRFLGAQNEVGLTQITSVGLGMELDSSAYDIWVTRWRAVLRYKFGPQVTGWSLGLAVSF